MVAATLISGTNFAVAGSVQSFTPRPTHVTVHHAYTSGNAPHRGFVGRVLLRLFGVDDLDYGPQHEVSLTEAQRQAVYQLTSIPSEAERYRVATGKSLPAAHGLIVLPPATPNGDQTYIWPTSQD